jgi:hypothetical protein
LVQHPKSGTYHVNALWYVLALAGQGTHSSQYRSSELLESLDANTPDPPTPDWTCSYRSQ